MADELLWAFGVVDAGADLPEIHASLPGAGPVIRLVEDGLALLATWVPGSEFGEAPLRRNLNDLGWLEQVARAHEDALDRVLRHAAVVPLRLTTIFESEASATRMLAQRAAALRTALDALGGRQEWSVKLLADVDAFAAAGPALDGPEETGSASAGTAYLLGRRAERAQREHASRLAATVAADVHARLADWAIDAVVRPAQNRELSGHRGEMLLNGAYLVETEKVPQLQALVEGLRERHSGVGARIELTGPFPPYNFVPELDR
jgi:Gas vesicle synthesis protein GvpL/GvpF